MIQYPKDYEYVQTKFTSNSRGTRNGRRVAQNVAELAQFLKPPVLCVGCGDGFEIECMAKALGIDPTDKEQILGVEVTNERVLTAKAHNLNVVEGAAENILDIIGDKKYNVYCAHTLEHCFNKLVVLEHFKKAALDTIVMVVPVELRGRTRNRAHYSPIANLGYIANLFGLDWQVDTKYRWRIELEGIIVAHRDAMNWPDRVKPESRHAELLVKGKF